MEYDEMGILATIALVSPTKPNHHVFWLEQETLGMLL
jgi:hypothetical protein